MVIVESKEEDLTMEKIESGRVVEDVEEGEISDSASVEEISEEDFRKQDYSSNPKPSIDSSAKAGDSRVWTAQDLYNFPRFRNDWYNLAWAHGVHNKPLFTNPKPEPASSINVVIDDSDDEGEKEKEDGELEEGEIDLDSEPSPKPKPVAAEVECGGGVVEIDSDDSYLEILGSVSVDDSEKSFEEVCSRIQHTLESLREAVSEGKNDGFEEILFNAVRTVNSVFCSMTQNQKELKKEALSRLLSSITSSEPSLLSPGHLNQVELMKAPLNSTTDSDLLTPNADSNGRHHHHHERTSVKWPSVSSVINNNNNINNSNPTPAFKSRGLLLPLLDLHKDHDEDSLPSPTRDAPPSSFPVMKPLGITKEDSSLLRYETDAFKAVSTYQQKFGRNSFMMTDMLPSPTPSEEESGGDGGDNDEDDTNMEISSSLVAPILIPPSVGVPPAISVATSSSTLSQPTPPAKALARSRDPRLRFANPDPGSSALDLNHKPLNKFESAIEPLSSKKQKGSSEMSLDGPILKRQRNALESSGILGDNGSTQLVNKKVQLMGNSEADPRRSVLTMSNFTPTNGLNVGAEQVPMTSTINSLPELLKDITGNPEILLNILKGQQQRLAHPSSDPSNDVSTQPLAPNLIPQSKPSGVIQPPPGNLSITSQRSQDDTVKIRMKPRDPRRVLHCSSSLQKAGNPANEQLKTTAGPITMNKDSLTGQKIQEGQTVVEPDIARQFTKSLRNIANIMSVSAPTSQSLSSQVKTDRGDLKGVTSNHEDQMSGAIPNPEMTVSGPSRGPTAWGDVEHLFEGYDDKQKIAIQRERERRLEEQKKMFEARKLCLVLDLDHTLLNSAKFVEVDIAHDEILRKKEEQDREKPQRHLYRLPHMGMWTKLRPGIWNFLDKASKLFEMHLYTMGNKLYATEMAKVLDPKGTLFSGRVISRGDDGDLLDGDDRVPKSKDLEGVLGMESAVVIVDDSVRVWPHNKLNLIVVERYTYFPCSRRQFGLPGPSLLEIDHDERPEDGTLASSLGVIEKIHQNFFSHKSLDEADVRTILASEQQKILAGCRIVFSRVFPVSEVKPHLHPLWQTAQQFGATCTTQIDDQVTHVVANSAGTDKVNWAIANGRFAVHPGWVEASALLYRRANEQDFTIKPTPS